MKIITNDINCIDIIGDFIPEFGARGNITINLDEHDDPKDMLDRIKDIFPRHCISNNVIDEEDLKYLSKPTTYIDSDLVPKQEYGCFKKYSKE